MGKEFFIRQLAEKWGVSLDKASSLYDGFVDSLRDIVADHEEVRLTGFGIFTQKVRAARTGRNPRTGEAIEISEKKYLAFKPWKTFYSAE